MAWPEDVLPIRQELLIDGVWTDYTSRTRGTDQVRIIRGYSGEQASLSAGTAIFKLDNADGLFTNNNPSSALYGKVGRNTQYRCSIVEPTTFMRMTNATAAGTTSYDGARAWTADKAVLDITGDLDVRWDGEPDAWTGVPGAMLAARYLSTGDQRSWAFFTDTAGYVYLTWSPDGTSGARRSAASTVAVPAGTGRLALRATLDVNNGAAGCTVTFYTSDTIAGSWTILGSAVVAAGTTSVHAGTSQLEVGTANTGQGWHDSFTVSNGFNADVDPFVGKVYGFELRAGIAGTLVANFDPTSRAVGDTSWSDDLGTPNTWTLDASAEISDADFRFWGELIGTPKGADGTSTDVYVTATASDLIGRLSDGNKPVHSAVYTNLARDERDGYWTMEQETAPGTTARTINAAYGQTGRIVDAQFTTTEDFPGTSGALVFTSDNGYATGSANWDGANTGVAYAMWYFKLASVPPSNRNFMRLVMTGGNTYRVDVVAAALGFDLNIYNSDGVALETAAVGYGTGVSPAEWLAMRILFTQDGADVNWEMAWYQVGSSTFFGTSGTYTGTIGRPRFWQSLAFTDKSGMELAHVVLDREDIGFVDSVFQDSTNAYDGERVYDRWKRLGVQLNIPLWYHGFKESGSENRQRTITMGPQLPKTPIDLLTECAEADGGLIFAPRDKFGIELRPIVSMINQDAPELDYSAGVLSGDIRPDPDAFRVRNDVTAVKSDGTFARYVKTSGPNNVNEPADDPQGVGTYDVQISRNVETLAQLEEAAQWEVALGTWDGDRYPQIQLETHRAEICGDAALLAAVRRLDMGSAFTLTDLPSWLPPGDVHLYMRGYTEMLQNFTQTLVINAAPYGPYRAGIWDGTSRRVDSASTTLAEALTTTETIWDITTVNLDDCWSTTAEPYDVVVAGERCTVTNCTAPAGTGPYTQTMTCTRSVNGVVKTHAIGEEIHVYDPARWTLGEGGDVVAAGDPVYAADINQLLAKPMVRLVQASAQSIPDATATKLTFGTGSEEWDTHDFHDESTNNTRITPSVPGYYTFKGAYFSAAMTTSVTQAVGLAKNGAVIASYIRAGQNSTAASRSLYCEATVQMNGSSDYMELEAFQDSSGAVNTVASGSNASIFECVFERPL